MRRLFAIALLATAIGLPPATRAQAPMGAGFPGNFGTRPPAVTHPDASISFGRSQGFRHHHFPPTFFVGEPLFADYAEAAPSQAPPVIVMQTPAPAPEAKEEPKAVMPLLIELQGDHYVRYGGVEQSPSRGRSEPLDYAEAVTPKTKSVGLGNTNVAPTSPDLPAAVLIFRDGRREEAISYVIIGPVIYVSSNYWTSGSWSKKIQLADLDLPATFKLNQDRGVKFVLPAGPNEVVTRP